MQTGDPKFNAQVKCRQDSPVLLSSQHWGRKDGFLKLISMPASRLDELQFPWETLSQKKEVEREQGKTFDNENTHIHAYINTHTHTRTHTYIYVI